MRKLIRGSIGGQWIAPGLLAFLTVVLSIAAGIAVTDPRLQVFVHPSEYLVGIVGFLLIVVSIVVARRPKQLLTPFDNSKLDRLRESIHEVEVTLGSDPELKDADDWEEKLTTWEGVGRELITMSITSGADSDEDCEIVSEDSAQQFMRLMNVIMPAMSQRGHREQLIELAGPAYKIGMKLKRWDESAQMAYNAAHAYYDLHSNLSSKQGQRWVLLMQKSMEHIDLQPPHNEKLLLLSLEVRGLLFRDFEGKREEARDSLKGALVIALKLKDTKMTTKIYSHLGELEEIESNKNLAIDYYQKALVNASDDVDRQLYCYNKLGQLALVDKRNNDAYDLYSQQLALSNNSWERWYWESLAHEGIARAILKMPAPDMKEAYQHARKALDAGGKVEGPRVSTLRRLVIQIADNILEYK
jgi:tetratricopeptide (TPR) repeat protein